MVYSGSTTANTRITQSLSTITTLHFIGPTMLLSSNPARCSIVSLHLHAASNQLDDSTQPTCSTPQQALLLHFFPLFFIISIFYFLFFQNSWGILSLVFFCSFSITQNRNFVTKRLLLFIICIDLKKKYWVRPSTRWYNYWLLKYIIFTINRHFINIHSSFFNVMIFAYTNI